MRGLGKAVGIGVKTVGAAAGVVSEMGTLVGAEAVDATAEIRRGTAAAADDDGRTLDAAWTAAELEGDGMPEHIAADALRELDQASQPRRRAVLELGVKASS